METLKKLKIWLIEWKYFRQLKIVLFALLFSTIFYIVSIEYLFPLINKLYSLLDKVLFYLFFACSFISVIIYLIIFHIKYLSEHLASLVSIFLILVMVFLSQYISCHRLTFWFVVLCIVVFVFLWISLLHIRDICDVMEKPKKIIKQYSPIQIDSPIDNIVDDKLGRKEFVRHTVDFFVDIPKGKRGLKVVLSGGWGEGKTSCLNIILKKLFKKGAHHIIEVNPWFNDTKQQLLDAILEQINLFISTNKPYENIDYEIKNLLKLVKIDTNFFSLSCAEEDKDIKNVVSDIGRVLDNYDKRIIVSFDDLDRLPKDKILSVLQVTEMFSQYTNIIFILSMDRYKVEQVLCEVGDACSKNGDIRNVSQYKNYIEKIASIIIKLPKPRAYFVRKYLVETLNLTLRHLNKEELSKVDVDFYLSLERFNSLRDVKRVLNAFYISFSEVKNEVSVTDYFNLTVLYCFYPDIYQKVYKDRYIWFGNILQSGNNEELKETVKKYFYNILDSYSEEKEILKDLINHITPALYIASGLKDDLEIHKEAKSYLLKEDLIVCL